MTCAASVNWRGVRCRLLQRTENTGLIVRSYMTYLRTYSVLPMVP